MTRSCCRRRNALRARLFAWAVCAAALAQPGCGRTVEPASEALPGRSRPIMAHEWKHPRDFVFQPTSFEPPDPGEVVRTSSGVRAFVLSNPEETVVRYTVAATLGRLYEHEGEAGTAAYVAGLLANPARWPAGRALSDRLAALGAQVQLEQSHDLTRLSLEVLSEDWREGLQALVSLLRRVQPDPAAVAAYRTGPGYAGVLSGVDSPGFRPAVELERRVARYAVAPADAGRPLSRSAVETMIGRSLSPQSLVIGIGGNLSRADAGAALEEATRGWQSSGVAARMLIAAQPAPEPLNLIDAPILEGWVAIGRWVDPVPPQYVPALAVMADILGTRLNIAAREVRGLANRNVFVLPAQPEHGGLMHIRTGGRPEAVAPLVKVSMDELRRLSGAEPGISAEELERAKGALVLGKWQAALDGVRTASGSYAVELLRQGTIERFVEWPRAIQAVTAEQVNDVARQYLDPTQMATVVVGPLSRIRAARHPRWATSIDDLARR